MGCPGKYLEAIELRDFRKAQLTILQIGCVKKKSWHIIDIFDR